MDDVVVSRRRARRRSLLAVLAAALTACASPPVEAPRAWLDQYAHSNMACGPTSILNAIRHRLPQAITIADGAAITASIARFGQTSSDEYDNRVRWSTVEGVAPADMAGWYNDERQRFALPAAKGMFLDRADGEELGAMLRRIHGAFVRSLAANEAVLLRLRSFAPAAGEGKLEWHGRYGHWVTVIDVQQQLLPHEQGFTFSFVDPSGAERRTAFAHLSVDRDFAAAKGNTQRWQWRSDRAFLVVAAAEIPELGRQHEPWHRRTLITFDYAIGCW